MDYDSPSRFEKSLTESIMSRYRWFTTCRRIAWGSSLRATLGTYKKHFNDGGAHGLGLAVLNLVCVVESCSRINSIRSHDCPPPPQCYTLRIRIRVQQVRLFKEWHCWSGCFLT